MNSLDATGGAGMNGHSSPHEVFVLTDEQILEIEPETIDGESRGVGNEAGTGTNGSSRATRPLAHEEHGVEDSVATPQTARVAERETSPEKNTTAEAPTRDTGGKTAPQQPPEWLAQRMRDPWNGAEAREFWEGLQRDQQETAAYRKVFAKPEEARASAERAKVLDEFDLAYFGAPGKQPQELSASRAQLAQRMLQEDPAAFREMVFAGLRALEGAEKAVPPGNPGTASSARDTQGNDGAQLELANRYATFEKAANDDLERSVGVVIDRTLQQALPGAEKSDDALKGRLNATIRQEIEKALQGDQQLGEQVSRLLAARKFDDVTRGQVVRLIGERAAQLVPGAAKRVLGDWTQTAIASHRTRSQRGDEAVSRKDLVPAGKVSTAAARENNRPQQKRDSAKPRGVDYRKLSDEQILEMQA